MFAFDIFAVICTQVYKRVTTPYTLQEVLMVFEYFFNAYMNATGEAHPPIKKEQIARIIEAMPFYDKAPNTPGYSDIAPEDYPILIDKYFETPFQDCDYRINHFFSGDIRTLRMYEELY